MLGADTPLVFMGIDYGRRSKEEKDPETRPLPQRIPLPEEPEAGFPLPPEEPESGVSFTSRKTRKTRSRVSNTPDPNVDAGWPLPILKAVKEIRLIYFLITQNRQYYSFLVIQKLYRKRNCFL